MAPRKRSASKSAQSRSASKSKSRSKSAGKGKRSAKRSAKKSAKKSAAKRAPSAYNNHITAFFAAHKGKYADAKSAMKAAAAAWKKAHH